MVRTTATRAPSGTFRPTSASAPRGSLARRAAYSSLDQLVTSALVYASTNAFLSSSDMGMVASAIGRWVRPGRGAGAALDPAGAGCANAFTLGAATAREEGPGVLSR